MKFRNLWIGLALISVDLAAQKQTSINIDANFSLSYISLGLGSNMWQMQPMFKVTGSNFLYTLEQAWRTKTFKKRQADTLLIGNLRQSSIDSILDITRKLNCDSIYKLNPYVMSGGIIYLDIASSSHKMNFKLDNSFDASARKIVDILNNYIPENIQHLWISEQIPTITEIK